MKNCRAEPPLPAGRPASLTCGRLESPCEDSSRAALRSVRPARAERRKGPNAASNCRRGKPDGWKRSLSRQHRSGLSCFPQCRERKRAGGAVHFLWLLMMAVQLTLGRLPGNISAASCRISAAVFTGRASARSNAAIAAARAAGREIPCRCA